MRAWLHSNAAGLVFFGALACLTVGLVMISWSLALTIPSAIILGIIIVRHFIAELTREPREKPKQKSLLD